MRPAEWCACTVVAIVVTLLVWLAIWTAGWIGLPGALFTTFCASLAACSIGLMTSLPRG